VDTSLTVTKVPGRNTTVTAARVIIDRLSFLFSSEMLLDIEAISRFVLLSVCVARLK